MTAAPLTRAEIDLDSLRHNVGQVRDRLRPDGKVLAVVKADAYGHGALPVGRAALEAGASMLGVARLEEGVALREGGITAPVLVMGGVTPDAAEDAVHHDLRVVVFDLAAGEALGAAARRHGRRVHVHVKVDTGMSRLGFVPEHLARALDVLGAHAGLVVEGVMTHLADAEGDREFTDEQLDRFERALGGRRVPLRHAANSAGILATPRAHLDMVRPGLLLYGCAPSPEASIDVRPVLRWSARIVQVRTLPAETGVSYGRTFTTRRPTRVAVVPVGYADGLDRGLSNVGRMLVRGRPAPIVGRICMDLTMVDVTDHDAVQVGDEVVIIGQQGAHAITAQSLADLTGTIPYEVLCRIGPRVPRVYRGVAADAVLEKPLAR